MGPLSIVSMPQLSALSHPASTLTQQSTMERETLKLSQRLMLSTDIMDTETTDTLLTDHMPTDHMLMAPDGDMARDPLMLKPRLTQLSSTPPVLSTLQFTPLSAPHSSLP